MKTKILEIRDRLTFFAVICIDMNPVDVMNGVDGIIQHEAQRYLLRRNGYPCDGKPNIAIAHARASGDPLWNDPHGWGGRTYPVAHIYIIEHWDEISDGDVIDVEYILGETQTKKVSERIRPY